METLAKTVLSGAGATLAVDCWTLLLKVFGGKSQGVMLAGRWLSYFPQGKFFHDTIIDTPRANNELVVGWIAHYCIGILFAFVLIAVYGKGWFDRPRLIPAIATGIITLAAPVFVFQPAAGFGIAFSNMHDPGRLLMKITLIHIVYGIGLYLSALIITRPLNGPRTSK